MKEQARERVGRSGEQGREVRGAHASRVLAWASRPSHPIRSRRDAESSTRDACAPRTMRGTGQGG